MKIEKIILPILLFTLLSCSENKISSYSEANNYSTTEKISESSTLSISSSISSSLSSISSSSSEDEEKYKWNRNIRKLFDEYIDGLYIPYIDLGDDVDGEFSTSSTYGNLILTGDREFSKDVFYEIDSYYKTFDYKVSYTSTLLTATKDLLSIEVSENSLGEINVSIFYQEPYDESRGLGYWDNEIRDSFDSYLYSYQLPYFYMGCRHPFASSYFSNYGYYIIHGGRYDTRVFDNARIAFLNEGYTFSESKDYNGLIYTFKKTFTSGDEITIELENYSFSKPKNIMKVYFSEGFYPSSVTSWTSSINDDFKIYIDNHTLPFFYMGTRNIYSSFITDKNSLYVYGGNYDERIYSYAITAFIDDGYSYTETRDNYGRKIIFEKKFSDGCYLEVTLASDSYNKVYLSTFFLPYMVINSSESEYSNEIQSLFANYSKHIIPYVYLGRDDLDCYFTNTKEEKSIIITGDKYNPNMALLAKTAYENDGYEVSLNRTIYGYDFYAKKTFSDDVTFIVTMDSKNYNDKGSDSFVELKVQIIDNNDYQEYNSDIKRYMNSLFSLTTLPYVFLSTAIPYTHINTSTKTLKLTGGIFKSSMISSLKQSMNGDTNDWEIEEKTNSLIGLAYFTDHYIEMKLEKDSDGYSLLSIQYLNEYSPKDNLTYSTTLTKQFTQTLNNYIPPYMYLNIDQPSYYIGYSNVHALVIKGGLYDERVFSFNKTILENNSFTVTIDNTSFSKRLIATKEDTNYYYRIQIEKESSSSIARLQARIAIDEKVTLSTSSFDNSLLTMLNEHSLSNLPVLDFGSFKYAKYNEDHLTITYSGYLKNDYVRKNKGILESNGFEVEYEEFNSDDVYYFFSTLKASYIDEVTNEKIYISFFPTYPLLSYSTYVVNISHNDAFIDDNIGYSSSLKKDMIKFLQGYELPYIYLGKDITYSCDDTTLSIIGDNYDRSLFDNIESKLSNYSTFTCSKVKEDDDSYYYLLENSNGDSILLHAYMIENKTTSIHKSRLDITFTRGENRVSKFDDDQIKIIKNVLNGNEIPYLDLGVDNDALVLTPNYSKNEIEIKGGKYKEIYLERIKKKLKDNGYTVLYSSNSIFSSKTIDENTVLYINISVENNYIYLKASI